MMRKKFVFAVIASVVLNVANASVFTLSSTGTVKSGMDPLGLFGEVGRNLNGLPFSVTVTIGLDESATYFIQGQQYSRVTETTPYIAAVTIGGFDYAFSAGNAVQSTAIVNAYDARNAADTGVVALVNKGYDQLGRFSLINQSLPTSSLRSNSLAQYFQSWTGDALTSLQIVDGANKSYFSGSSFETFTINGTPATLPEPVPLPNPDPAPVPDQHPVPEPTSTMLFGAGLLGLAALRRRQSRR